MPTVVTSCTASTQQYLLRDVSNAVTSRSTTCGFNCSSRRRLKYSMTSSIRRDCNEVNHRKDTGFVLSDQAISALYLQSHRISLTHKHHLAELEHRMCQLGELEVHTRRDDVTDWQTAVLLEYRPLDSLTPRLQQVPDTASDTAPNSDDCDWYSTACLRKTRLTMTRFTLPPNMTAFINIYHLN